MSRRDKPRTEADLRAAFAAKATEAPNAAGVLRAVRLAERRRRPRRWLLPATAVLAAAAVAAAIPLMLTNGTDSKKSNGAAQPAAGAGGGQSAPGAATTDKAATGGNQAPLPRFEANSVCRADQVTTQVSVSRQAGAVRATLTVTARTATCTLARVPRVVWGGAAVRVQADATAGAGGSSPQRKASDFGQLPAGSTATAVIASTDPCGAGAGDAVAVDWGAGPVAVQATGATRCVAPDSKGGLSVGAFTGLS